MSAPDLWKFLAGLGLFLYGIRLMEQGTQKIAGRPFKIFLRDQTTNLVKAIAGGTILTGIIQSSSVVILMLMSFVGAGIIPFRNALAVLIGSNLGTTVDSWFYATVGFKFNLQEYSLPLIAVTAIAMFFVQGRKQVFNALSFVFSIGIILLGFGFMKEAATQLVGQMDLTRYVNFGNSYFLLLGFVITVIIQSSSATVAIVLTALHAHAIPFPAAAAMIIGSELGTTIKFLFTSIRANAGTRMLAWGDFIFNLFTVLIAFSGLHWIVLLIQDLIGIKDELIAIVFFQSFINLLSILMFLPFLKFISARLEKMFSHEKAGRSLFDADAAPLPDMAAPVISNAAFDLLHRVLAFHNKIMGQAEEKVALLPGLKAFTRVHGTTDKAYAAIKETEGEILKYYTGIADELPNNMRVTCAAFIAGIRQSIHASKSIHDIRLDLQGLKSSANNFLFDQYHLLIADWLQFARQFTAALDEGMNAPRSEHLHEMLKEAKQVFDQQGLTIQDPLGRHEVGEIDASTLLNVMQELYSSKKALLNALILLTDAGNQQV
ncbi:MAG: Sodium-dependent phosphate transporter [Ferruginibacter sp.]|nr:Sodium-dependent phosphate transporter [Ferruginibacter sp.]